MSDERSASEWGWFTHTHDPRDGSRETVLFAAETLLAIGLLLRVVAHVVASGTRHPDGHPYDVDYGLRLGWQVREPQPPWSDQFATAVLVSAAVGSWAVWTVPGLRLMPGLLAVLGANLAVVAGDPLWLLLDQSRNRDQ